MTDLQRMYDVASDDEAATLDELQERAGLTWRCALPSTTGRPGWTCGWINVAEDDSCDNCGRPRSSE